ncbi:probable L-cysteine desulfhydrase, chloroplastic [Andrographis paniculata]|uniref:probable L-cysteine desulfhydrase, chloroplastic n=1 Tax=Andrographis paniculata TaxID=175694 RepID=UPI0021E90FA9|nr:probable L-cysteine desulfhydrase, chloroplastic [Andrographis paniculata]XP_051147419.1 probable L-cysteine desulfhydrase, chloroplastic [Andrographis paniculata]
MASFIDCNGATATAAALIPKSKAKSQPQPITQSEILAEFAHHDPTVARINNGSFGSCPASIIAAQQRHQLLFLRQPDYFYFNTLKPSILKTRRLIQSLINADHIEEVSIVDNATTAAAVVLQHTTWSFFSADFHPGDAVILLHYAYGAVKKSVQAYVSRAGGHIIEVHLPFPLTSNSEVISEFRKALELGKSNGRKIRLAVIDHITSMPCVVIPVKELVTMCRDEGVDRIFVDGAHAIGNVAIDVKNIGADFYTSNLHKWLFCPPSAAFLYCKSDSLSELHHPVVSHEYGNGLAMESSWTGTRDYSAQLVLPEVMEFIARFEGGIEGIMLKNHGAVVEMAEMLVKAWGTELGAPPEMCASMAMVGLPTCLGINSDEDALKLRAHLRECFKVEVPIYYKAPVGGEIERITAYARISHQVYNVVEDYYRFRDAVNKLVEDGFTCACLG